MARPLLLVPRPRPPRPLPPRATEVGVADMPRKSAPFCISVAGRNSTSTGRASPARLSAVPKSPTRPRFVGLSDSSSSSWWSPFTPAYSSSSSDRSGLSSVSRKAPRLLRLRPGMPFEPTSNRRTGFLVLFSSAEASGSLGAAATPSISFASAPRRLARFPSPSTARDDPPGRPLPNPRPA